MRYYVGLAVVTAGLAVVLGGIQLFQWWGNADVSISLRYLNQQIAPAAVSCPTIYYPRGATEDCLLEGPYGRTSVAMLISDGGIAFADPTSAELLLDDVRGDL